MSPTRTVRRRLPAAHPLFVAVLAVLPLTAAAQDATPAQKEAATLDAVKVTAARKVENIQDVPVSISTVSDEKLDGQ